MIRYVAIKLLKEFEKLMEKDVDIRSIRNQAPRKRKMIRPERNRNAKNRNVLDNRFNQL
jgi:hypothetical protein